MTHLLAGLHDDIRLAVAALTEPVTITLQRDDGSWVRGINRSWIDQLVDAIATTTRSGGGGRSGGHALPICIAAIDLYDRAFNDFRAPGYTLKQSIEAIPATLPGNEDVIALQRGLRMLKKLKVDIERIFTPTSKLELKSPCPTCGIEYMDSIDELGETVRQRVLIADIEGAECRSCGELWQGSRLEILAEVLTNEIAS